MTTISVSENKLFEFETEIYMSYLKGSNKSPVYGHENNNSSFPGLT